MGKEKVFKENPPEQLLVAVGKADAFPTISTAERLWNLEEGILKNYGLWKNKTIMIYETKTDLYSIESWKSNYRLHSLCFYHWKLPEETLIKNVTITKGSGKYATSKKAKTLGETLNDVVYGRIISLATSTNAEDFNEVEFD